MHWDTLKQGNYSTVRGDGGSRVGEVRAGTTSPMPEHKGFIATVTVRDPPNHTSSLRVKKTSRLLQIFIQCTSMDNIQILNYDLIHEGNMTQF